MIILGNMERQDVCEAVESASKRLEKRGLLGGVFPHTVAVDDLPKSDMCLVFGGDGTLLSAGRRLARLGIPFIGVNMGKLGFLAEYNLDELYRFLPALVEGKIKPVERIMLDVCCCDFCSLAVNDLAISAGAPFRMIDLSFSHDENMLARFRGDGLVVATPTGSTGYNLSVGGPVLQPTLDAIAVSPIAPHTLSLRPIVLDTFAPVHINVMGANAGTTLIIDGQISHKLCAGQSIVVRKADVTLKIFPHPERHYTQLLSNKLKWGQSPHH
ncbi:MAG TPA: NAD(+)/NADH kinase [Phycisphaerae bacterium]|nr:NAD(+)/NADH kinase [Phycisphaerae bacterium]HPS53504.1 NAD(+)/NADH kinase [Phycisphaerae bacterium]